MNVRRAVVAIIALLGLIVIARPAAAALVAPDFHANINFDKKFVIENSIYVPSVDTVVMTVTYENQEGRTADPIAFKFTSPDSVDWSFSCTMPAISPFRGTNTCTVALRFAIPPGRDTFYVFHIEARPIFDPADADPTNDPLLVTVLPFRKLPELVAAVTSLHPAQPKAGDTVTVVYTMTNIGFDDAKSPPTQDAIGRFTMKLFLDSKANEQGQLRVVPMAPGTTRTDTRVVYPWPAGNHTIIAVADPFFPTWADAPTSPQDPTETGLVTELFENLGNCSC